MECLPRARPQIPVFLNPYSPYKVLEILPGAGSWKGGDLSKRLPRLEAANVPTITSFVKVFAAPSQRTVLHGGWKGYWIRGWSLQPQRHEEIMSSLTPRAGFWVAGTPQSRAFLLASSLSLESALLSFTGGDTLSPFCLFSNFVVNWPSPTWQHRVLRLFYPRWVDVQSSGLGELHPPPSPPSLCRK